MKVKFVVLEVEHTVAGVGVPCTLMVGKVLIVTAALPLPVFSQSRAPAVAVRVMVKLVWGQVEPGLEHVTVTGAFPLASGRSRTTEH